MSNSKITEDFKTEIFQDESYLAALFWQYPEFYSLYSPDKISDSTFLNPIWGFYFDIGRKMADQGLLVFDDKVTYRTVEECGKMSDYESYNGYQTIKELMVEVTYSKDNFETYFDNVTSHSAQFYMLKELAGLFGNKVVQPIPGSKYNYKEMSANQLWQYWNDKVNTIGKNVGNPYEVYNLLEGLEEMLEDIDENPDMGLPFFQSKKMTDICLGWAHGCVTINASFSGKGKTSLMINKLIMSCIEHNEKVMIIANEEGIKEFRRNLLITAMGNGTKDSINRQKLISGKLTPEEKDKVKKAIEWIRQLCSDKGLIKFAALDVYTIENVKKIVTYWANRGYKRLIIDTGKPSDGGGQGDRWERFADDFKDIHKLTRANGGGLNLATWVNVQLADSAARQRFLDSYALAECKKIKNEASVLFLGRPVWDDEYAGGANQILVYNYVPDPVSGGVIRKEETLESTKDGWDQQYYLLFTDKNRRGKSNDTGLHILVFHVDYNSNRWREIGWTIIPKTFK